eukprot:jgi/Orpsp1_1/1182418/evm.model.c7180000081199.1
MAFSNQFKTILWKNWKIFRQRSSIFSIAFELFFTFLIISTLSVRQRVEMNFESTPGKEAIDITYNFAPQNDINNGDLFIAFVLPNNQNNGDDFISLVMNDISIKQSMNIKPKKFNTEQQLLDYVRDDKEDTILCGVIFNNSFTDYTIKISGINIVDSQTEPISNYAKTRFSEMQSNGAMFTSFNYKYTDFTVTDTYNKLFIYIQKAVDNAIIQLKTTNLVKGYKLSIGKLSEPSVSYNSKIDEKIEDKFDGLGPYLMFIIFGQIFHLSNRLMEEKENKTREGLIAIGANPCLLSFTWEIIYFPLSLFLMAIIYIFNPCNIIDVLNPILYIGILIFYTIAMYSIVVIVTNIVKKYRTVLVMMCLFVSCMITLSESLYNLKLNGFLTIHRIISAIFPFFGLGMAMVEIGHQDDYGKTIGLSTMFNSDFGINFIFVIIDAFIYFTIAILLERFNGVSIKNIFINKSKFKSENDGNEYKDDIQEDPIGSECYVEVKNIYKFFKFRRNIGGGNDDDNTYTNSGNVFAANKNISFKVYKNKIFAILGHNGAGKSTLIQNMVGIVKPDEGETYYRGLPLSKNKKEIHRQLGICLQSNVLFEGFTVADHFKLYTGIKG